VTPSAYRPEFCDRLIEHMARGLSFDSFGGVARVSRRTLYNWIKTNPEFEEAYEVGKLSCLLWWETQSVEGLSSEFFQTALFVVNMRNRFGWRDKSKEEAKEDAKKFSSQGFTLTKEQFAELTSKARAGKPK